MVGAMAIEKPVTAEATTCVFDAVRLEAGPSRLAAALIDGGETAGPQWVEVKRID
jgi:hypothetical protein